MWECSPPMGWRSAVERPPQPGLVDPPEVVLPAVDQGHRDLLGVPLQQRRVVEDGDLVRYTLFDRGASVDEYWSVPEFRGPLPPGDVIAFNANPTVVARLTGAQPAEVRRVARTAATPDDLPPALELHAQIAELMGVEP